MSDAQSIRPFLAALEREGALVRVAKPVDREFELSAFLSAADAGPALIFDSVVGSPLRVAGNLLNSRARIAAALGIGIGEIVPRIHQAIRAPVKPEKVAGGRVQEVVTLEAPLAALPVPRFFERENRAYITAGVILARDPSTGRGNASFARFATLDDRTAMVGIAPNHHLALFSRRAAEAGKTLEIAVVIGAHPAIQLAACLYLGVGDDELECAGSLLGRPVDVVPAKTVDLMVPADAELILEGRIDAGHPIEEGLVSEYHGMYEQYGPGFLATFSALTRLSPRACLSWRPADRRQPFERHLGRRAQRARCGGHRGGRRAHRHRGPDRRHPARAGPPRHVRGVRRREPGEARHRRRSRHRSVGCRRGRLGPRQPHEAGARPAADPAGRHRPLRADGRR
jgi:4-hydroxy-3-polyprenylbenzoate decarboxylase